jgi:hypothetical protein
MSSGGAWTLQLVLRPKFIEKLTFVTHAMDNFSISYCKRNTRNAIGAAAADVEGQRDAVASVPDPSWCSKGLKRDELLPTFLFRRT